MNARISAPNLAELYRLAAERYDSLPAFSTRLRKEWEAVSYGELYRQGLGLATALIDLGVQAREHVGLFGDNRLEWILADYGVQLCGAADVPRGRDVTDAELVYIINHAGIRVVFLETESLQEKVLRLRDRLPDLRKIILLDPAGKPGPDVLRLTDLVERGNALRATGDRRIEGRVGDIRPDDLFTLIYTSGTTGRPKGVMLTHANMVSQLETIPIPISSADRILSILPVWHIFERVFEMLAISCGACTYYTNIRTLGEDLKTVRPTFMGSAPRLWESLHQRILKNVSTAPPVRRALFQLAYRTSNYYQESLFYLEGRRPGIHPEGMGERILLRAGHRFRRLALLPWHGLFDALILKQIRQGVGGALKATVSGGGALPAEIDKFFNAVGIPVLEGYGLTESSPVLAVRTHEALVVGTVGPPIPRTEVRIVCLDTGEVLYPNPALPHDGRGRRGEIWVRGPQVMKGYYRDPESTERTLRDGWLRTGDLGMMTLNDCLQILGRCKETIVLSSGENLEPGPIEMRLRQSPLIENCMVVGQDQKWIGALIVPDPTAFHERGIATASLEELSKNPEAQRLIGEEIRERICEAMGFKSFERIRGFRLLPEPLAVGEELTNLFKLKRHVVEEKYKQVIEDLFRP